MLALALIALANMPDLTRCPWGSLCSSRVGFAQTRAVVNLSLDVEPTRRADIEVELHGNVLLVRAGLLETGADHSAERRTFIVEGEGLLTVAFVDVITPEATTGLAVRELDDAEAFAWSTK